MGPRTGQQPLEHRLLLTATFCLLAGGAVMVYSRLLGAHPARGPGRRHGVPRQVRRLRRSSAWSSCTRSRGTAWRAPAASRRRCSAAAFLMLAARARARRRHRGQRRARAGSARARSVPARRGDEARPRAARRGGAVGARPEDRAHLRGVRGRSSSSAARAVLLVAAQPDLGTALVIAFTLAAMLVAAGLPLRQLGLIAGAGGAPGPGLRARRALPPRAADRLPEPVGGPGRRRLPVRPGPDRDRLGRAVRARPRRRACRRSSTCPRPTPTSSSP